MLQFEAFRNELAVTVEIQVFLTVIGQADELSRHTGLVQARIACGKTDSVVGILALIGQADPVTELLGIGYFVRAIIEHASQIEGDLVILLIPQRAGSLQLNRAGDAAFDQ